MLCYAEWLSLCKSIIMQTRFCMGHFMFKWYRRLSPAVNGLKKKNSDDGSVTLTWQVPEGFNKTGARYIVAYEGDTYTLPMAQTEFVVPSGKEKKTFNVEVRIILLILTESYRYKHLAFFIGRLVFFVFIFFCLRFWCSSKKYQFFRISTKCWFC